MVVEITGFAKFISKLCDRFALHARGGWTEQWKQVFRAEPTECAWKQAPIWKQSPAYISPVQIGYHDGSQRCLGALLPEPKWWTTASCGIGRPAVGGGGLQHFSSPRIKTNTKEKYSLRTQTRLPSDLLGFLIDVWDFCGSRLLKSFPR